MFVHKLLPALSAVAIALSVAVSPAAAAPSFLNANFTEIDADANTAFNEGRLFFIQDWNPVGFASNSQTDPGQFNNGVAGGRSVVGFLSGPGTSLSQVVSGFVAGMSYRVSVLANGRAGMTAPTLRILADGTDIFGPATVAAVDPSGVFATAFTTLQSDQFVAADTFVTITFANASTSDIDATTLLSAASISDVPEPMSLALLGMGLAGIGIARRRRA